jgi:hypothetical protein
LTAAKIVKPQIRREWLNKRISEAVKSGRDVDDAIRNSDEADMEEQTRISRSPTFVKKYCSQITAASAYCVDVGLFYNDEL